MARNAEERTPLLGREARLGARVDERMTTHKQEEKKKQSGGEDGGLHNVKWEKPARRGSMGNITANTPRRDPQGGIADKPDMRRASTSVSLLDRMQAIRERDQESKKVERPISIPPLTRTQTEASLSRPIAKGKKSVVSVVEVGSASTAASHLAVHSRVAGEEMEPFEAELGGLFSETKWSSMDAASTVLASPPVARSGRSKGGDGPEERRGRNYNTFTPNSASPHDLEAGLSTEGSLRGALRPHRKQSEPLGWRIWLVILVLALAVLFYITKMLLLVDKQEYLMGIVRKEV